MNPFNNSIPINTNFMNQLSQLGQLNQINFGSNSNAARNPINSANQINQINQVNLQLNQTNPINPMNPMIKQGISPSHQLNESQFQMHSPSQFNQRLISFQAGQSVISPRGTVLNPGIINNQMHRIVQGNMNNLTISPSNSRVSGKSISLGDNPILNQMQFRNLKSQSKFVNLDNTMEMGVVPFGGNLNSVGTSGSTINQSPRSTTSNPQSQHSESHVQIPVDVIQSLHVTLHSLLQSNPTQSENIAMSVNSAKNTLRTILKYPFLSIQFRTQIIELFRRDQFRYLVLEFWKEMTSKSQDCLSHMREVCEELLRYLIENGDRLKENVIQLICMVHGKILQNCKDLALEFDFVGKITGHEKIWERPILLKYILSNSVVQLQSKNALILFMDNSIMFHQNAMEKYATQIGNLKGKINFKESLHKLNSLEESHIVSSNTDTNPDDQGEVKVMSNRVIQATNYWNVLSYLANAWYMLIKRHPSTLSLFLTSENAQYNIISLIAKWILICPLVSCSSIRMRLIEILRRLLEVWPKNANGVQFLLPASIENQLQELFSHQTYREPNFIYNTQQKNHGVDKVIRPLRELHQYQYALNLASTAASIVSLNLFQRIVSFSCGLLFDDVCGITVQNACVSTLYEICNVCFERVIASRSEVYTNILLSIHHILLLKICNSSAEMVNLKERIETKEMPIEKRQMIVTQTMENFLRKVVSFKRVSEKISQLRISKQGFDQYHFPIFFKRYLEFLLIFTTEKVTMKKYLDDSIQFLVEIFGILHDHTTYLMFSRNLDYFFQLMQVDSLYIELLGKLLKSNSGERSTTIAELVLEFLIQKLSRHTTTQEADVIFYVVKNHIYEDGKGALRILIPRYIWSIMKLFSSYEPHFYQFDKKEQVIAFLLTSSFLLCREMKVTLSVSFKNDSVADFFQSISRKIKAVDCNYHSLYIRALLNAPFDIRTTLDSLPILVPCFIYISQYGARSLSLILQLICRWLCMLKQPVIDVLYRPFLSDFLLELFAIQKEYFANGGRYNIPLLLSKLMYYLTPLIDENGFSGPIQAKNNYDYSKVKIAVRLSEGESHDITRASILDIGEIVSFSTNITHKGKAKEEIIRANFYILQSCISGILEIPDDCDINKIFAERIWILRNHENSSKDDFQECEFSSPLEFCEHKTHGLYLAPLTKFDSASPKKSHLEYKDELKRLLSSLVTLFHMNDEKSLSDVAPKYIRQLSRYFLFLSIFSDSNSDSSLTLRYIPPNIFFDALVEYSLLMRKSDILIFILDDLHSLCEDEGHFPNQVLKSIFCKIFAHCKVSDSTAICLLHDVLLHLDEINFGKKWLSMNFLPILQSVIDSFDYQNRSNNSAMQEVIHIIINICYAPMLQHILQPTDKRLEIVLEFFLEMQMSVYEEVRYTSNLLLQSLIEHFSVDMGHLPFIREILILKCETIASNQLKPIEDRLGLCRLIFFGLKYDIFYESNIHSYWNIISNEYKKFTTRLRMKKDIQEFGMQFCLEYINIISLLLKNNSGVVTTQLKECILNDIFTCLLFEKNFLEYGKDCLHEFIVTLSPSHEIIQDLLNENELSKYFSTLKPGKSQFRCILLVSEVLGSYLSITGRKLLAQMLISYAKALSSNTFSKTPPISSSLSETRGSFLIQILSCILSLAPSQSERINVIFQYYRFALKNPIFWQDYVIAAAESIFKNEKNHSTFAKVILQSHEIVYFKLRFLLAMLKAPVAAFFCSKYFKFIVESIQGFLTMILDDKMEKKRETIFEEQVKIFLLTKAMLVHHKEIDKVILEKLLEVLINLQEYSLSLIEESFNSSTASEVLFLWKRLVLQLSMRLSILLQNHTVITQLSFHGGYEHILLQSLYRLYFVKFTTFFENNSSYLDELLSIQIWNVEPIHLPNIITFIVQPLLRQDVSEISDSVKLSCLHHLKHKLVQSLNNLEQIDPVTVGAVCRLFVLTKEKSVLTINECIVIMKQILSGSVDDYSVMYLVELVVTMLSVYDEGEILVLITYQNLVLEFLNLLFHLYNVDSTRKTRELILPYCNACMSCIDFDLLRKYLLTAIENSPAVRDPILKVVLELNLLKDNMMTFTPLLKNLISTMKSNVPNPTLKQYLLFIGHVVHLMIENGCRDSIVNQEHNSDEDIEIYGKKRKRFQRAVLKRRKLEVSSQEKSFLQELTKILISRAISIFKQCELGDTQKRMDPTNLSESTNLVRMCISILRKIMENFAFISIDIPNVIFPLLRNGWKVLAYQVLQVCIEYQTDTIECLSEIFNYIQDEIKSGSREGNECTEYLLETLLIVYPLDSSVYDIVKHYDALVKVILQVLGDKQLYSTEVAVLSLRSLRIISEHATSKFANLIENSLIEFGEHLISISQIGQKQVVEGLKLIAECQSVLSKVSKNFHLSLFEKVIASSSRVDDEVLIVFLQFAKTLIENPLVELRMKYTILRAMRRLKTSSPNVKEHFCRILCFSTRFLQFSKELAPILVDALQICESPEQRRCLLSTLYPFTPNTLSGCLSFIFTHENWPNGANNHWLRISSYLMIQRIVSTDSVQVVASKIPFFKQLSRKLDNRQASCNVSILDDFQDLIDITKMIDLDELLKNIINLILYGSPVVVASIWKTVFLCCFTILPEDMAATISDLIMQFLIQPRTDTQNKGIHLILAALQSVENLCPLNPELLSFIAMNSHSWNSVLPILEGYTNEFSLIPCKSDYHKCLFELYSHLGENNLAIGAMKSCINLSTFTRSIISFYEFEDWKKIQEVSRLSELSSKFADLQEFELCVIEDIWLKASENLQQWNQLELFAKYFKSPSLFTENARKNGDINGIQEWLERNQMSSMPNDIFFHWKDFLLKSIDDDAEFLQKLSKQVAHSGQVVGTRTWYLPTMHCNEVQYQLLHMAEIFEMKQESMLLSPSSTNETLHAIFHQWKQNEFTPNNNIGRWTAILNWRRIFMNSISNTRPHLKKTASILSAWASNKLGLLSSFQGNTSKQVLYLENSKKTLLESHHTKGEENLELVLQEVSLELKSKGTLAAILLLENLNMKCFKSIQQADLLRKRAILLSRLGRIDESNSTFSRAVSCAKTTLKSKRLDEMEVENFEDVTITISHIFLDWFNTMQEIKKTEMQMDTIHSFLFALKYSSNDGKAKLFIPRFLNMIEEVSIEDGFNVLSNLILDIPSHYWIPYISTILTGIESGSCASSVYHCILATICHQYPDEVFYNLHSSLQRIPPSNKDARRYLLDLLGILKVEHELKTSQLVLFVTELQQPAFTSSYLEEVTRFVSKLFLEVRDLNPEATITTSLELKLRLLPELSLSTSKKLNAIINLNQLLINGAKNKDILPLLHRLKLELQQLCFESVPSSFNLSIINKKLSSIAIPMIGIPGQFNSYSNFSPFHNDQSHILKIGKKVKILTIHSLASHRELSLHSTDGKKIKILLRSNSITDSNLLLKSHIQYQEFLQHWANVLRFKRSIHLQPLVCNVVELSPTQHMILHFRKSFTLRYLLKNEALKSHTNYDLKEQAYLENLGVIGKESSFKILQSSVPADMLSKLVKQQSKSWSTYFNVRKKFTNSMAISSAFSLLFEINCENVFDELFIDYQTGTFFQFKNSASFINISRFIRKNQIEEQNEENKKEIVSLNGEQFIPLSQNIANFISPIGVQGPFVGTIVSTMLAIKRYEHYFIDIVQLYIRDSFRAAYHTTSHCASTSLTQQTHDSLFESAPLGEVVMSQEVSRIYTNYISQKSKNLLSFDLTSSKRTHRIDELVSEATSERFKLPLSWSAYV